MSRADLNALRDAGWDALYPAARVRIAVGMGTCGKAAGAQEVLDTLSRAVDGHTIPADVVPVGCRGMCFAEPIVEVKAPGWPRVVYGEADAAFAERLVAALESGTLPDDVPLGWEGRDWIEGFDAWVDLVDGGRLPDSCQPDIASAPFLRGQTRRISASWGRIVPWSAKEYAACGGYEALSRAVEGKLAPDQLIEIVESSGLRGRGGAGFPTGRKWRAVAESDDPVRYVVANGDEGDPGAFMDRALMESDPHRLIEGMALAAFAMGAHLGYVFTRSEYPGALATMEHALDEARRSHLVGKGAFDGAFDFDIRLVRSAGTYVCGEETALIAAMEGRLPHPAKRPPYPSEKGLLEHPTCINNVETYANVPSLALHGADRFRAVGTEQSPGTKLFSLAGSIERTGLVEVALGTPLRTVVEDMADLVEGTRMQPLRDGKRDDTPLPPIAVQIGGPSGAVLPLSLDGLTLDFEGLAQAGGIMGSGGVVVLGPETCIADTVRYFLSFSAHASCGACKGCRDGLAEATELMEAVCAGTADRGTLERLDELAKGIPRRSKCSLGKMAVTPLASGLRHFRDIFEQHLRGICASCMCKDLMHFEIIPDQCPGCLCCLPSCPTGAIKGTFGKPFTINQNLCTKCWMCVTQCPYPALKALPTAAGAR